MSPRHLGLIANDGKAGAGALVAELAGAFDRHQISYTLETRTALLIGRESAATTADLASQCDLLVVLGGDGTMLKVMHELDHEFPPLLGINLGTLGFLTCVSSRDWEKAVEAIAAGNFQLSKRSLLDVEVRRGAQVLHRRLALNDAVVTRGELSRLIRLNVFVDRAVCHGERLSGGRELRNGFVNSGETSFRRFFKIVWPGPTPFWLRFFNCFNLRASGNRNRAGS